jgi:Ca-activated chloride channel family protein
MSTRRWNVVGIFVCLLVLAPVGHARQQATGVVIGGTVTDIGGGAIPGATVALETTDAQPKVLTTKITNSEGKFRFEDVAPGRYQLITSLTGFKTLAATVTAIAGVSVTNLRVVLEVGQISEAVTVMAGTELVRTQSATVSSTLNADQVNRMPTSSRNALNAVTFLPGVSSPRDSTVSGLPQNSLNITLDGVSNTTIASDGFFSRQSGRQDSVEQVALRGEAYAPIVTNPFLRTIDHPLSTFAADVDTASYTNVRRFLSKGQLPPADAVRIEELVNYFKFNYPEPRGADPVSITTEVGDCPWAPGHKLALIGLRAKRIADEDAPRRNITLLLDVSGSMQPIERLPLIKSALRMFVDTLRNEDRIAIVVYASASGLVLDATPGSRRQTIHEAIESLEAGGSTNGADGIQLAYHVARRNFVQGGVNRVILATDGDFNVGITNRDDLLTLIERERRSGVFLSVLGVGSGNLKDATMELLADKGNGHYAYLDSLQEARRVLVREGGATLETVAKDVKLQIEFNPAQVVAYKLIGYENRLMAARDFNDDTKDGGELGAGHTVTVLYELVPADIDGSSTAQSRRPAVDPLRYQVARPAVNQRYAEELLTVKVRYKAPSASESQLMEQPMRPGGVAPHLPFAAAVAEFGMLLRDGQPHSPRWSSLSARLRGLTGAGSPADREAFSELVETAAGLKKQIR